MQEFSRLKNAGMIGLRYQGIHEINFSVLDSEGRPCILTDLFKELFDSYYLVLRDS